MVSSLTRRRLLQSSVAATTAIAGCGGFLGGSDPDAGTGSYGILLRNDVSGEHTVRIEATYVGESDPVFSETVDLPPGEQREWESVLTEESRQYLVRASLENANFYDNNQQNRAYVSVDTSTSPDVENVVVRIAPYYDLRTVWVNTTREEQI